MFETFTHSKIGLDALAMARKSRKLYVAEQNIRFQQTHKYFLNLTFMGKSRLDETLYWVNDERLIQL
jgi:hypothetical protein